MKNIRSKFKGNNFANNNNSLFIGILYKHKRVTQPFFTV